MTIKQTVISFKGPTRACDACGYFILEGEPKVEETNSGKVCCYTCYQKYSAINTAIRRKKAKEPELSPWEQRVKSILEP